MNLSDENNKFTSAIPRKEQNKVDEKFKDD